MTQAFDIYNRVEDRRRCQKHRREVNLPKRAAGGETFGSCFQPSGALHYWYRIISVIARDTYISWEMMEGGDFRRRTCELFHDQEQKQDHRQIDRLVVCR